MMQRTIGTYIANKVKDEIFKPVDVVESDGEVQFVEEAPDSLHGELIRDARGAVLGRAYRVPASVYVVAANAEAAQAALGKTLSDPEHDIIVHWADDEISALVFVDSEAQSAAEKGPQVFRATDI